MAGKESGTHSHEAFFFFFFFFLFKKKGEQKRTKKQQERGEEESDVWNQSRVETSVVTESDEFMGVLD